MSESKAVGENPTKTYKTWAEVDLSALRANWRTISAHVHESAPHVRMIAVVKANAYGHGAGEVSCALMREGCDFFAVACSVEAEALRAIVGSAPDILILGYSVPQDVCTLVKNHVTQTVFSTEYAMELSREMERLCAAGEISPEARLRVHIKLDTGMNRLGFFAGDAASAAEEIAAVCRLPHLAVEGMFTHFACADTDHGAHGLTAVQHDRFCAVAAALREKQIAIPFLHCCNSAAGMDFPAAYHDGVRAGVILYGMSPDGAILPAYRPVMTLKTRIAHIHTLHAGESVSYGATFTAPADMRIATLPLGYADGFVRHYAGAALTLPDGTAAPIIGRICMDQCMIAIGDADVHPGDVVTVFGGDGGARIEALARQADTINYEITSILTQRVPRVYLSD